MGLHGLHVILGNALRPPDGARVHNSKNINLDCYATYSLTLDYPKKKKNACLLIIFDNRHILHI